MTQGRADGPRVELMSYKNHVYILVGRKGEVGADWRVPDDWIEERGIVIVDPWAASMGHECVYESDATCPYKGMVRNLLLVAQWPTLPEGDDEDD